MHFTGSLSAPELLTFKTVTRVFLALATSMALCAVARAENTSATENTVAQTSNTISFPTSGTVTATQIGDGLWWHPELDETSVTLMLDNLQSWEIRNLYIDVFRSGETLFPSSVLPQQADATDRDWLAYIISQAHSRNIRVHAWLQVLCWQEPDEDIVESNRLLSSQPDWVDATVDGLAFDGRSLARYVNPGVPEVRSVLLQLTQEICQYPIDGFNMDAMEYNYRADMGYNPYAVRQFQDSTGIDPTKLQRDLDAGTDWMEWTSFREDQLTSLVQLMATKCRSTAEERHCRILVSANVQPGYEKSRGLNRRYQNWLQWVDEQIIDLTVPECFSPDLPGLEKQLWDARTAHMGSKVACVPALVVESNIGTMARPSLSAQKRVLHNTGFQHANFNNYQGYLLEMQDPDALENADGPGFWDFLRSSRD